MFLKVKLMAVLSILLLAQLASFYPKFDGKTDPEIQPYVDWVVYFSKGKMVPPKGIGFAWTNPVQLGNYWAVTDEIRINRENWGMLSEHDRFLLIAHEIGHGCGYKHNDKKENGCYTSFMSHQAQGLKCTRKMLEQYKKEMSTIKCER